MTATTDEIKLSDKEKVEHFRLMVHSLKKERDSLKCCGNCKHLDMMDGEYGLECGITQSEKHQSGGYMDRSLPACDKWEHNKKERK